MGYKHNQEDIINTGMELFRKNGYHNVGINEILIASGIPKGSFYNFFKSKEDFAVKGLVSYGEGSLIYIRSFLSDEKFTPLQRLKNFYKDMIDSNEPDGMNAGCLVNIMSMEVGAQNAEIGQAADNSFTSWLVEIAACVKQGQDAGEIKTTFAPLEIAEYLHAGTYGGFSRMKVTHSLDYLRQWYNMTFDFIST